MLEYASDGLNTYKYNRGTALVMGGAGRGPVLTSVPYLFLARLLAISPLQDAVVGAPCG